MNALLAQFIPEARDLLEQAGAGMLALEREANDPAIINDVFRAVHTLKGSSGLFDVAPLTRLVHAAEDLLGEVRTGDLAMNSEIVDRLLESLDLVGGWIDALEAREQLPADAESTMTARVAVLRAWLSHAPEAVAVAARLASSEPPDWLVNLSEADRRGAFAAANGPRLLAWSFDPEEDCFFRGDNPIAMLQHSPGLLALEVAPREPFPPLADVDPLACMLRFEVLSDASRDGLEEHMRYVAERVEIREIAIHDLAIPTGARAKAPVFRDFATLARRQIAAGDREALERSIASLLNMIAPASIQASALRWCNALMERDGLSSLDALQRLIGVVEDGVAEKSAPPAIKAIAAASSEAAEIAAVGLAHRIALEQLQVLQTPTPPSLAPGRTASVAAVLRNLAKATGVSSAAELDAAIRTLEESGDLGPLSALVAGFRAQPPTPAAAARGPEAPPTPVANPEGASDGRSIPRVLRVDQGKIDAIMNLVAELIVAKNGLSYLATRAEQVHGSRLVAREIKDQYAVIDRITQGLQVGVMSVRMMPVGQVFQRFPRLVRDISRKLGKKIELVIEGEETQADKNVLESLADPLIHMVRNSLDHGIEPPDERLAAGKPETGVLRIAARQENDFVVIEVSDDGRGIDPARIKAKALGLGLLTPERAESLTDQEAVELTFLAGFSTKEEVTDLSGRGVGLDVVRSAVTKAGGEFSLRSELGRGATVVVRLPLTMAVTRIVTIDCCGRIFGIPMDLVAETVKVARERIHRIKDMETFVLRDAIVPIVRLACALGLPNDEARREEEAVMVLRIGRERIGMVVDGFLERLEVIVKPLEGILEGMTRYSGTALLGNGQILLILDLREILR